jgi:hypothetical protein
MSSFAAIQSPACYVTAQVACSAFTPMYIYTCGTGVHTMTPSGGQMVDMASIDEPGALGTQNEPQINCHYSVTVTFCDDTSTVVSHDSPVTPTSDNGQGPCPPRG